VQGSVPRGDLIASVMENTTRAWVEIVERCQDAGWMVRAEFLCPHGLPERSGAAMGQDPDILEKCAAGWRSGEECRCGRK